MSRFFNLDLHCSVITDVATQFRALGHDVDSHNMSGHTWALNLERASKGTGTTFNGKIGYGSLTLDSWPRMFRDTPEGKTADNAWMEQQSEIYKWVSENYDALNAYDGFVVCYPPVFAMLYATFGKPIILDIPVRYEQHFTERPNDWHSFNKMLQRKQAAGLLHAVANNRYDSTYYEYFTGLSAHHISSTCDYIDKFAPKWSAAYRGSTKLLAFGDYAGCRAAHAVPDVLHVRDVLGERYRYDEIVRAKGFVWIPYTTSIMSFFEHYWLEVPLFIPSQKFLAQLFDQKLVLSGATCHKSMTGGSNLPRIGTDMPDPHTREGLEVWMPLYDFYNTSEFPHVTYFNSWKDLKEKAANATQDDLLATSAAMRAQNVTRKAHNLESWRGVLSTI